LPSGTADRHCLFDCCADHRDLHSFPTRRSSDLLRFNAIQHGNCAVSCPEINSKVNCAPAHYYFGMNYFLTAGTAMSISPRWTMRSEEHTSELQSRENLVCRLLLEKKKKLTEQHC